MFNSIRHMQVAPGELVGIQGLGGLGHLALQYASKMGYRVAALSSTGAKEKFVIYLANRGIPKGKDAKRLLDSPKILGPTNISTEARSIQQRSYRN